MKQVDFYLIVNQVSDAQFKLASRLSNKLSRLRQRALIVTDEPQAATDLSAVMWSFSDTSFVAHDVLDRNTVYPGNVHISDVERAAGVSDYRDYQVLINLSSEVPVFNHHFDRIAEIVEADEGAKAGARHRYRRYAEEGFEIKTHSIEL